MPLPAWPSVVRPRQTPVEHVGEFGGFDAGAGVSHFEDGHGAGRLDGDGAAGGVSFMALVRRFTTIWWSRVASPSTVTGFRSVSRCRCGTTRRPMGSASLASCGDLN
jgi:hypothetical protein